MPTSDRSSDELSALIPATYGQGVRRGSEALTGSNMTPPPLAFGIPVLDRLFGGGLSLGTVSEWGVPMGLGGREVILSLLARATHLASGAWWCLWVRPLASELLIYPPAWEAAGIDLSHLRFAHSARPVEELKPLLADAFFRLVVFDEPERLTPSDMAYLAREARRLNRLVLVLQSRWLKAERGTVWAKTRVNCWRERGGQARKGHVHDHEEQDAPRRGIYRLETVRGLKPASLVFRLGEDVA